MTSTIGLHFKKHKNGTTGLKRHVERLPNQKHSNKNIKNELTKDNIFLRGDRDLSYQKRIDNIIKSQLGDKNIRKDAVKLVTTTVQLGGDITNQSKSDQISTLKSAFDILKNDFGEHNIVSAVIHVDETTPHLHFDFVPIINNKLSAKSVLGNKIDLRNRQNKFLSDMQNKHPDFDFARKSNQQFNGLEQSLFEKMTEEVQLKEKLLDDKIVNFASDVKIRRSELNERESRVITHEKELEQREGSLNASKDKINNAINNFNEMQKSTIKKLNDKEKLLNQRSDDLNKREDKQDKRELTLNEREKALNQYHERIKKEHEEKDKELEYKKSLLKSREHRNEQEYNRREDELASREQALTIKENSIKSTLDEFKNLINEQKIKLSTVEEYDKKVDKLANSFNFGEEDFVSSINELNQNNLRGNSFER